jgi:hypothetical protein
LRAFDEAGGDRSRLTVLPHDRGSPYTPEDAHREVHHGTELAAEAQPGLPTYAEDPGLRARIRDVLREWSRR